MSLRPILDMSQFVAEDGSIDYGHIVRFWRKKVLGWSHAQLIVDLYNELLEEDEPPVSIRWWQRMEQMNQVPKDEKRRRLIQVLLGIPPAYLGLTVLDTTQVFLAGVEHLAPKKVPLEIQDYEISLPTFWRSSCTRRPEIFSDLITRVAALEHAVLYGMAQQRAQASFLLCHYLCAAGNAYRYQGYMSTALDYLGRALTLARENNDESCYAKAFYLRGFTFFNIWTNWQSLEDYASLHAAIADFQAAHQISTRTDQALHASLKSAILADGGRAQALLSQDQQDRLKALQQIDRAGRLVSASSFQDDAHFLHIDADWCFIDKAEALLASGCPGSALEELENVCQGDPQARQRYFYTNIIEAEASIAKGWVDVGVIALEESLKALSETTSRRHLLHIMRIHEKLKRDDRYKNSREVARLSGRLLKITQVGRIPTWVI